MWTRGFTSTMGLDQEEFNQIFLTALGNDAVVKKLQTVLCSELHKEITLMHNMIKSKDEKITQLENKVEILEDKIDDLEQYGRRNSLRFNGVSESDNEDVVEKAMKLMNDTMKVTPPVSMENIDRVHRVSRKKENAPRGILVKFATYNVCSRVFRSKKNLKIDRDSQNLDSEDKQQVFVNEDLTQTRSKLLWQARTLKRQKQITDCWSWDGNILVKDKQSKIIPIKSEIQLLQFAAG